MSRLQGKDDSHGKLKWRSRRSRSSRIELHALEDAVRVHEKRIRKRHVPLPPT